MKSGGVAEWRVEEQGCKDELSGPTRSLILMLGYAERIFQFIPPCLLQESVLLMLCEKLQTEALRTYLFFYSSQYSSLSLDTLVSMFGLPEKRVYRLALQPVFFGGGSKIVDFFDTRGQIMPVQT